MNTENSVRKTETNIESSCNSATNVATTHNKMAEKIVKFIAGILSLSAIMACVICDLAITKTLSWSLYPVSAIALFWLVVAPVFYSKKNKIEMSLLSLCIFILPFLFCISQISGTSGWLLPLGFPISVVSIICLWLSLYLFKKMKNKWYAASASLVTLLVSGLIINAIVSLFLSISVFTVWSAMAISIVTVITIIFFAIAHFTEKT